MKIYLVRHGQTDSNAQGIYNYLSEDLNENGIKQAEELKNKIDEINYDIVIASPLVRALHTAQIINIKKKEIIIDDRLQERKVGSLAGVPLSETNRDEYWNYYSNVKFGTEESVPDLCTRVKDFIDDLKTKKLKSVLIVAHSGVSKAFYVYFNGIPTDGNMLNVGLKNANVAEYEL